MYVRFPAAAGHKEDNEREKLGIRENYVSFVMALVGNLLQVRSNGCTALISKKLKARCF
jgi:hypothetical protein